MTVKLLRGDCREVLKTLPDCSVQMICTSPPYWAFRSYLPADHPDKHLEIGSEPTVDAWVETIVGVMRECRRVLKDDGVMFLNLGDSYSTGTSAPSKDSDTADHGGWAKGSHLGRRRVNVAELKPKNLIGQPWRAAFALQAGFATCSGCSVERRTDLWPLHQGHRVCIDCLVAGRLDAKVIQTEPGWWLRQDIIWSKPAPMPESAKDRCTKAHEYIFLLSKQPTYFWDFDAMQEPTAGMAHPRGATHNTAAARKARANGDAKSVPGDLLNGMRAPAGWDTGPGDHRSRAGRYKAPDGWNTGHGAHGSFHPEGREKGKYPGNGVGFGHGSDAEARGRGRVVTGVNPKAAKALNGSAGDEPGAGWREKQNASFSAAVVDTVDTRNPRSVWTFPSEPFKGSHYATFPKELARRCITAGSRPGDVVLDPFGGSGTVGMVADAMGREAILIDLDERNIPMAHDRIRAGAPLFASVETT